MRTWSQVEQLITERPALQCVVTSTKVTAAGMSAPLSASACPAKAITPKYHLTNHFLSPLRPLVLKRDQLYVQPLLNSEQTMSLQRNCYPVNIQ